MEMNKTENQVDQSTQSSHVLQYDDQFPPLPMCNIPKHVINSKPRAAALFNSNVTQSLVVPLAERRFAAREGVSHNEAQKKICQSVAQKCGVSIELNSGLNDQNLSLFISGPQDKVLNAKKILSKELQTQTHLQLTVSKEYHKYILGRNGATLREIENNSSTSIKIPRPMEDNEVVIIYGTREGIDLARNEIGDIVTERSKLANEKLTIPRRFYPFISATISRIREETNVKINVPPVHSESDDITVSGDRDNVLAAVAVIGKMYDELQKSCSSLNLPIAKCQHRYVIGPKGVGIAEVLEKTGVSVEMPSQDSSDDTIVLFGPSEQLAAALSLVIQRAESMLSVSIPAAQWLHRFIIGKSGASLNKLTEKCVGVSVHLGDDDSDEILIEGPRDEVNELRVVMEQRIAEIERTIAVAEIIIDQRFHRHIVGRNGANIQRMQDEYKVQIRLPGNNGSVVRIEGDPSGVSRAKEEMECLCTKLANEASHEVNIEHKYHTQVMGQGGSRIKELRALFPEVAITFPEVGATKSDVVVVRGPRTQVDVVVAKLEEIVCEVKENNYVAEVRVLKQWHKNVIGKAGCNIRRIRDECDVRVELPEEQSASDVIRVIGKRPQVEEAASRIEGMQAEWGTVKEVKVTLPKMTLRGKLVRAVQEQCGGVMISSDTKSDVITIRGIDNEVDHAQRLVCALAESSKDKSTCQDKVCAKAEYHKFLIGRKGVRLAEFIQRHAVMLLFPDNEEEDKDVIVVVGAKDAVSKARAELEATIKALENEVEVTTTVEPKWHKHFFLRRQQVLEELSREFGGVRVFFPRQESGSDQVRVVGPKGCVEACVSRIKDILDNLEAQTSITVMIEQRHHRVLITRNMTEIKALQNEYEVQIKFPSRPSIEDMNPDPMETTEDTEECNEDNNPANCVTISGRLDNCHQAKDALLELVPVSEDVPLDNDWHRNLIGQKGQGINTFSTKYSVQVNIPQASLMADHVSFKGTIANINEAKTALADLVDQWEKEKQDRIARNFELSVNVPATFHRQIIGQRGANIDMFRSKFNVNIQIPDQSSGSSTIVIRGYEEDATKAKDELLAIVARLEAQVKEELHIPREVHPLLIGTRGINLKKLRDQFKVEVNFPNRNAEGDTAQLVEVIGDKDDVDKCCDYLIERANELLEELEERNQFRGNGHQQKQQTIGGNDSRQNGGGNNKTQSGFQLAGAPWQQTVPDALSKDDFPTMIVDSHVPINTNEVVDSCLSNGYAE